MVQKALPYYQVFRRPGLGLPEELQVVLAGDVLQQGFPGVAVGLPVFLWAAQVIKRDWLSDNMVDEDTRDWNLALRILQLSKRGGRSQSRVDLIPLPLVM